MADYKALLEAVKQKTDMKMKVLNPESAEHESADTVDGKYIVGKQSLEDYSEWTRSFFTGQIAYMYSHFKDEKYLDYLKKSFKPYNDRLEDLVKVKHDVHHDAGFLYLLYSSALYAVSGDEDAYKMTWTVTDEYSKRFRFRAGVFPGFAPVEGPCQQIIIDDMMNIAAVMWIYRRAKHPFYKKLIKWHLKTIFKTMVRDDCTVRHSYYFDENTGEPAGELNYCGYAPGSAWARGTSWMVYGLTNAIITLDEEDPLVIRGYYSMLNGVLNKYLSMLGEDGIPAWDLYKLSSDGEKELVDTSAAAILASAIYKLRDFCDISKFQGISKNCVEFADKIMETLAKDYMAAPEAENVIEGGQCGPRNAGCVWGDYFFTEALMRKVYGKDCPEFWI